MKNEATFMKNEQAAQQSSAKCFQLEQKLHEQAEENRKLLLETEKAQEEANHRADNPANSFQQAPAAGSFAEPAQNLAAATAAPSTPVSFPTIPASFAGTMPSHFGIGSDDPASFRCGFSKDHEQNSNFSFGTTLPLGGGGL